MPDLYLFQKYSDSYICEDQADLKAVYGTTEDEESSYAADMQEDTALS